MPTSHLPFGLTTGWLLWVIFRVQVGFAHEQGRAERSFLLQLYGPGSSWVKQHQWCISSIQEGSGHHGQLWLVEGTWSAAQHEPSKSYFVAFAGCENYSFRSAKDFVNYLTVPQCSCRRITVLRRCGTVSSTQWRQLEHKISVIHKLVFVHASVSSVDQ